MRLSAKLTIAMSLVAGILYVPISSAKADQLAFAVDDTGNLSSVDLTTAAATPIGYTGQLLEGLAVSPQGSLFGTDDYGDLYSVSKTTGAATLIGSTGLGDIEGLGFRGTTLTSAIWAARRQYPRSVQPLPKPRRSPAFSRAQSARWQC
jgi:hypothetical protein